MTPSSKPWRAPFFDACGLPPDTMVTPEGVPPETLIRRILSIPNLIVTTRGMELDDNGQRLTKYEVTPNGEAGLAVLEDLARTLQLDGDVPAKSLTVYLYGAPENFAQ